MIQIKQQDSDIKLTTISGKQLTLMCIQKKNRIIFNQLKLIKRFDDFLDGIERSAQEDRNKGDISEIDYKDIRGYIDSAREINDVGKCVKDSTVGTVIGAIQYISYKQGLRKGQKTAPIMAV